MIKNREELKELPFDYDVCEMSEDDVEEIEIVEEKKFTFKCKPCWNFQSIEFEVESTIEEALKLYETVLLKLVEISPAQDSKSAKRQPPLHPASEKQKEIMKKFGIKFDSFTSKEEAQELIQRSIDKSNE